MQTPTTHPEREEQDTPSFMLIYFVLYLIAWAVGMHWMSILTR